MRCAPLLLLITLSSCLCGEEPPDPIVDAGLIGDGDPVDPDAGPPLTQDAGPVVCEEDAHEENDERADAVVIAQADPVQGTFCGGDDDWFAVAADPDCSVVVDLSFDSADGDLDVLLYDPVGTLVGSAQTLGNAEHLNVIATTAGQFAARVRGGDRDAVPYALSIVALCPEELTCPNDDALEDNDAIGAQSSIAVGVATDAIVCPGDVDMFVVPADVGCIADMSVAFTHANGDIDVELLRSDGSLVAGSRSITDVERIKKVVSGAGFVYRVLLFGQDTDGSAYRITVDEVCEGELACPADDPFEPNDVKEEGVDLDDVDDQALGVICGEDEDFYDLYPQSGCTLAAELAVDTAEGDLDLELIETDGTRIAISATTTALEHIDYLAPDGGRVVLRVFSFANPSGAAQSYRLTVHTTCP